MKECPACRATIADAAPFCEHCGFRVAPMRRARQGPLLTRLGPMEAEGTEGASPGVLPPLAPLDAFSSDDHAAAAPAEDARNVGQVQPPAAVEAPPGGARALLQVEVTLQSTHNFYREFLGEISDGGIFVATNEPRAVGSVVDVEMTLPGLSQRCRVSCTVRWVRQASRLMPDLIAGLGLGFDGLDAATREAIEGFIAQRDPLLV